MSVIGSNILAGASGQGGGYNLTRSLRFRSSASANLSRTNTATGDAQKFTWSGWVKRGSISSAADQFLFCSDNFNTSSNRFIFQIILKLGGGAEADTLVVGLENSVSGTDGTRRTTQVFRDPSAWYHIVGAVDTTQATASNRIKVYVNGVEVTAFAVSTNPNQNANVSINQNGGTPRIGAFLLNNSPQRFFDGYLTEVNFIDGQALTPSSFGETSTTTGVWIPKRYTGTYGTNGFYLPFSDNTSTTTLGADSSGNGNNWTTNNISLTSGSTYDSMLDVPTLTSATASNYAVMNPLDQAGGLVFSEANLKVTAATGWDGARATFSLPSTGKYYWETACISRSTGASVGILSTSAVITGDLGAAATGYVYNSGDGQKYNNGSASSYGATWGTNDVIGIAWDGDAGSLVFYKNGTSQGTAWTGLSGTFSPAIGVNGSDSMNANFGQRPFAYTPPTGHVALNTYNLPTPTIGATASSQANKYFDIITYTGDGSSSRTFTGLSFQPDFLWSKSRSNSYGNKLYDAVRGVTKQIVSNSTDSEATTDSTVLQAFTSNGITFGSDAGINGNGVTFVDWFWKANGAGSSNTAGSITSTVSANTTSGFSIVRYTLNNSTFTVGHGLGIAPKMIFVKNLDTGNNWDVYHASVGAGVRLKLNSTDGQSSSTQVWNNTAPTSTVFSGDSAWWTNPSTSRMIAYCFAEVSGYSKISSYVGNGSSDGTFVYTGFRPKYVITKRASAISNWSLFDSVRGSYNLNTPYLAANSNYLEETASIDFLSNGFKFRDSGATYNGSGDTYIYMAFAENPFKYSLAR